MLNRIALPAQHENNAFSFVFFGIALALCLHVKFQFNIPSSSNAKMVFHGKYFFQGKIYRPIFLT